MPCRPRNWYDVSSASPFGNWHTLQRSFHTRPPSPDLSLRIRIGGTEYEKPSCELNPPVKVVPILPLTALVQLVADVGQVKPELTGGTAVRLEDHALVTPRLHDDVQYVLQELERVLAAAVALPGVAQRR